MDSSNSFPEAPSLNTKFEKLKADSRKDESKVNSRRYKLAGTEQISKPEKRVANQVLNVIPNKKLNENNSESSSSSSEQKSSYLQQAGNYVSGLLGNK